MVGDTDPSYPSIAKADRWTGVKFYYAVQVDDVRLSRGREAGRSDAAAAREKIGEGRALAAHLRLGQPDQRFSAPSAVRALC